MVLPQSNKDENLDSKRIRGDLNKMVVIKSEKEWGVHFPPHLLPGVYDTELSYNAEQLEPVQRNSWYCEQTTCGLTATTQGVRV